MIIFFYYLLFSEYSTSQLIILIIVQQLRICQQLLQTNNRTPVHLIPHTLTIIALSGHFNIAIRTRLSLCSRINHHRHRHRTVRCGISSAPIRRCKERRLSSRQTSHAILSCRCSSYTGQSLFYLGRILRYFARSFFFELTVGCSLGDHVGEEFEVVDSRDCGCCPPVSKKIWCRWRC